jgi:hypothetical protein
LKSKRPKEATTTHYLEMFTRDDVASVITRRLDRVLRRLSQPPDLDILPFAKPALPDKIVPTYIPDYLQDRFQTPEERASQILDIENVIDVDQSVVDALKAASRSLTDTLKTLLLNEGAAMLVSFDDASAFTEATMRDGLGIELEIDSSINQGIGQLIRLNILNACLEHISLPRHIKERFLNTITHKIAEEAFVAMQKSAKAEKYSSLLKNLHARVNGKYSDSVGSAPPIGVLKQRSRSTGAPAPNAPSDQIHDYNEQQNKGVRYG